MSKRIFVILTFLTLLYSVHEVLAQGQPPFTPPPPIPPHILYGEAYIDNIRLTQADDDVISTRATQLLIIFLDSWDSQGLVTNIINGLNATPSNIASLQQAFQNSTYCQSHGISLSSNATVAIISGSEWRVTDAGNTYTVKSQQIPVWNSPNWVSGNKLEVYKHNGLVASYTMGDLPTANYVIQMPVDSGDVLGGNPPNTYVLREPGRAMIGDDVYLYINGVRITDAPSYEIPDYMADGQQTLVGVQMNIHAPSTQEFTKNLAVGWNLISLPLQPLDANGQPITDPASVLSSVQGKFNSVWKYTPGSGWTIYIPGVPSDLNEMGPNFGYWIKMDQSGNLIIRGTQPTTTTINLRAGWNLIGFSSMKQKSVQQCLAGIENKINSVWQYTPGIGWAIYIPGVPSDLTDMTPGMGYWIKAEQDCVLVIVWETGP